MDLGENDYSAALTVTTVTGDVVTVPVASSGLSDRGAGWVAFTMPPGLGGEPAGLHAGAQVALAYHSRDHGSAAGDEYVLVQGHVEQRGSGVPVRVRVHRITTWPDARAIGFPTVIGAPAVAAPTTQAPPCGTEFGLDARDTVRRFRAHPHRLLSYVGGDGFPVTIPVRILEADDRGIRITAPAGLLPAGGRRAGLLALSYGPRPVGLSTRHHTGWLSKHRDGTATYVVHTAHGRHLPQNRALRMFIDARQRARAARHRQISAVGRCA